MSKSFLRLKHILGSPKQGIDPIIPVSKSTWWEGVASGRYPQGVKLSAGVTAWRKSDIDALCDSLAATQK